MTDKFPAVEDKEVIRVLKKIGFEFYRQAKGSHEVWRRVRDGKHTIIPRHKGRIRKLRWINFYIWGCCG
ncbi:MAG: hypothetical protein COS84_04770 [Armatimonadetes bacterium CG07_land_8_20_14_0_80_40_9]|nr:MAG: hypothetical protein COS84_04770 [Armatimonadetes bacterium CG07_land_8_20_14_0_80_40_9]